MEGFSPARRRAEVQLEARFDADLVGRRYAFVDGADVLRPNHVGSAHDKANAEFMLREISRMGLGRLDRNLLGAVSHAAGSVVELVAPTHFVAACASRRRGRRHLAQDRDELPPYNVYGADGDVTAELVYVNQGMPDDYKELERQGVSVKGRIVIARYGGGWRGLKPKLAYEHGAVGCLIYSDPRDDGYGAGDVYPQGGYRPRDAVQRGSVQDLTLYSGDPLTPGIGATPGAKRLAIEGRQDDFENSPCCRSPTRTRAAAGGARRRVAPAAGAAACR
jgi:N-acetylated-alpha-linked acidic dipeptidase